MVMSFHPPKTASCQEVWWCMRMGCLARTGTVALVSLGLASKTADHDILLGLGPAVALGGERGMHLGCN